MNTNETNSKPTPSADAGMDFSLGLASLDEVVCVSRGFYESLKSADEEIHRLRQEAAAANEKLLRLAAEIDNLKKRAAREKEEARKFSNESFAEDIAAAMDNFELGIQAALSAKDSSAVAEGMKMALMLLTNVMKKHGLMPIEAEGQPFDPNLHEALSQEECADVPDQTVLRQVRRGWKYHERLLRPASVIVSQQPSPVAKA